MIIKILKMQSRIVRQLIAYYLKNKKKYPERIYKIAFILTFNYFPLKKLLYLQ